MPRASSSRKSSSDASRPSSHASHNSTLQLLAMASPMGSTSEPSGTAPTAFNSIPPIESTSRFSNSGLHITVPHYTPSSSSKSGGNKGKDKAAREVPLAPEPVYQTETTPDPIDEVPFYEGPIYEYPIDEAPIYGGPIYGTSIVESPIVEAPPVCPYCGQFMTLEPPGLHSIMEPMCIECDRKYLVSGGSGGAGGEDDNNGSKKGQGKGGSKSGSKSKSKSKSRGTGQRKSFWSFFG